MQLSPLRLEKLFYTKLHIDANVDVKGSEHADNIDTQVECHYQPDNPRLWMVVLRVRYGSDESHYLIDLEVIGFFDVHCEYPEEKVKTLVSVNGPAVLYGSAREMVSNLTARGPHEMVDLPTVSFIDMAEEVSRKKPVKRRRKSMKKK